MGIPSVLAFAGALILGPAILGLILAFIVHRQNQRVLARRADVALQSMLQAGDFLATLANEPSLPETQRRRAEDLARAYPKGDQLQVFAQSLLADLRRAAPQSSP